MAGPVPALEVRTHATAMRGPAADGRASTPTVRAANRVCLPHLPPHQRCHPCGRLRQLPAMPAAWAAVAPPPLFPRLLATVALDPASPRAREPCIGLRQLYLGLGATGSQEPGLGWDRSAAGGTRPVCAHIEPPPPSTCKMQAVTGTDCQQTATTHIDVRDRIPRPTDNMSATAQMFWSTV